MPTVVQQDTVATRYVALPRTFAWSGRQS